MISSMPRSHLRLYAICGVVAPVFFVLMVVVEGFLACALVKVAHHGSMHSTPLDVYEKMMPSIAIVSTEQEKNTKKMDGYVLTRGLFPHLLAITALEECGAKILTTDSSYESQKEKSAKNPGSIVVVVPPGGKPRWTRLGDSKKHVPDPPSDI